jgi:hypothetical protein
MPTSYLTEHTIKYMNLEKELTPDEWQYFESQANICEPISIRFFMNCDGIEFIKSYNNEDSDYYLIDLSYTIYDKAYSTIESQLFELQSIDNLYQLFQIADIDETQMAKFIRECSIFGVKTKKYSTEAVNEKDHEIKIQYAIYFN